MATLYIIATPVGNLADISERALSVLRGLSVLACEDTRRTGILLKHHGISRPGTVFSHHEHNETPAARRIVAFLEQGLDVGVCSNAGYPLISDPGYEAVGLALEAGHEIAVIPGASAIPLALIASGLPASSYVFKGFPPRRSGQRQRFLAEEVSHAHTLVIYESPYRVGRLLNEALEVLGDRRAAVCLELTKRFERVHRGWLQDLAAMLADRKIKGEAVVVIAGNHPKFVRRRLEDGGGAPESACGTRPA